MVLEPQIIDYIDGDETIFERQPLENVAKNGELTAFKHHGFWQCMDNLRDKETLEKEWANKQCAWRVW